MLQPVMIGRTAGQVTLVACHDRDSDAWTRATALFNWCGSFADCCLKTREIMLPAQAIVQPLPISSTSKRQ